LVTTSHKKKSQDRAMISQITDGMKINQLDYR